MTVVVSSVAFDDAALRAWREEADADPDPDPDDAPQQHWLAREAGRVVGALHAWHAPDGRRRLYVERCSDAALAPLVGAVRGPAQAQADADGALHHALLDAGFAERRREHVLEIPVRGDRAVAPTGVVLVTGERTELAPLLALDCAIRQDIPGSDGWQPDAAWFQAETYDSPSYDPTTYVVAIDGETYVGLARVWRAVPDGSDPPPLQRLGCVGVVRDRRRQGLGRALVAAALAPLRARGVDRVRAEVDATNSASLALLAGFGAAVTGATVELAR